LGALTGTRLLGALSGVVSALLFVTARQVVADQNLLDGAADALIAKLHPPGRLAYGSPALRKEFDGPPALRIVAARTTLMTSELGS